MIKNSFFMILIIISKLVSLFLIFFIFFLCIFYIPLGYFIRLFNIKWSVNISQYFSYALWEVCNIIFRLTFKIKEATLKDKYTLIISNHVSAMDFMVLNHIFKTKGTLKYLIKKETKYFPIFYQMIDLLKFIVVSRKFEEDEKVIKERLDTKSIIALFPEGTRYTKSNVQKSQDFCVKRNYPVLNNVLYPRYNGFKLIYNTMDNKSIADLTFTHIGKVPSLWQIFFTSYKGEIKYDLRIVNTRDVKEPRKWLEDCFIRKDHVIQNLRDE